MNMLCPKTPRVKDKAHVAFIHALPCCCTLLEGESVVAHHLLRVPTEERGAARKSGDNWTLPLANHVHVDLHHCGMDERAFLARYGVNGPALAALLYQMSGNELACRRAIFEMRGVNVLRELEE